VTPAELRKLAEDAIAGPCGLVRLVVRDRRPPRGERLRLWKGGPLAEVLCVNSDREIVVLVDARKLLDALRSVS